MTESQIWRLAANDNDPVGQALADVQELVGKSAYWNREAYEALYAQTWYDAKVCNNAYIDTVSVVELALNNIDAAIGKLVWEPSTSLSGHFGDEALERVDERVAQKKVATIGDEASYEKAIVAGRSLLIDAKKEFEEPHEGTTTATSESVPLPPPIKELTAAEIQELEAIHESLRVSTASWGKAGPEEKPSPWSILRSTREKQQAINDAGKSIAGAYRGMLQEGENAKENWGEDLSPKAVNLLNLRLDILRAAASYAEETSVNIGPSSRRLR